MIWKDIKIQYGLICSQFNQKRLTSKPEQQQRLIQKNIKTELKLTHNPHVLAAEGRAEPPQTRRSASSGLGSVADWWVQDTGRQQRGAASSSWQQTTQVNKQININHVQTDAKN